MWIFVSSCVYAPMRYPGCSTYWYLIVCIVSKDERDIPSKFGVSTPALLYNNNNGRNGSFFTWLATS